MTSKRRCLVLFALFFLSSVPTVSAESWKAVTQKIQHAGIQAIEEQYASMPPFYKYFDYPVCKEILDRRAAEDADRRAYGAEYGLKPLKRISGGKAEEEFEIHHRVKKECSPAGDVPCFASNTKIVKLDRTPTGDRVIETEIAALRKGDYVLGSTADQAREERYQVRACWTQVTEAPYEGEMKEGDSYLTIMYRREGELLADKQTLDVTTHHRVRATYWGGRMLWIDAIRLVRGYRIYGADGTFVLEAKPKLHKVGGEKQTVTNLQTETGNYFIGPKGSAILAHNEGVCT
ncbi:MAG: hypothetical protein V1495_04400 [Pseudomonadota bacterium]